MSTHADNAGKLLMRRAGNRTALSLESQLLTAAWSRKECTRWHCLSVRTDHDPSSSFAPRPSAVSNNGFLFLAKRKKLVFTTALVRPPRACLKSFVTKACGKLQHRKFVEGKSTAAYCTLRPFWRDIVYNATASSACLPTYRW